MLRGRPRARHQIAGDRLARVALATPPRVERLSQPCQGFLRHRTFLPDGPSPSSGGQYPRNFRPADTLAGTVGRDGCKRGAIEQSVLCRAHHFESLCGRPCPFSD